MPNHPLGLDQTIHSQRESLFRAECLSQETDRSFSQSSHIQTPRASHLRAAPPLFNKQKRRARELGSSG